MHENGDHYGMTEEFDLVYEEGEIRQDMGPLLEVSTSLIAKILHLLGDDIRIRILRELAFKEALSIRALARRLRCNYERIERALKQLEDFGLIQVYVVNVSEHKRYRFYSISKKYEQVLKSMFFENPKQ